jgi:hypothetical protein
MPPGTASVLPASARDSGPCAWLPGHALEGEVSCRTELFIPY